MLAKTAILRAWRVAWDICDWGRREGELSSLVSESSEEAEQGGRERAGLLSLLLLFPALRLPLCDLSLSGLRQLDSSCLER